MITRIKTAIVLIILVAIPMYFKGVVLDLFILGVGLYSTYELIKMYRTRKEIKLIPIVIFYLFFILQCGMIYLGQGLIIPLYGFFLSLAIYAVINKDAKDFGLSEIGFLLFAYLFIAFTIYSVYLTFNISFEFFLYPILMAIIADTGGYFGGRYFGNKFFKERKLIPEVSPKKTIEGAIAAVIFGTILGGLYLQYMTNIDTSLVSLMLLSFMISIISQFGDLFASLIKREFGIKDFSNLFPGHGGFLDRIDGIIFNFMALTIVVEVISSFMS